MMCINAAESTSSDEESMVDHDSHILIHNIYSHMTYVYMYIYNYICIERERVYRERETHTH